jgi:hypothetical protein
MKSFLTVEQLINELKQYPKDYKVLVDGYEGGLDAVLASRIVGVEYDETIAWYYGPFYETDDTNTKAIHLLSTRGQRV